MTDEERKKWKEKMKAAQHEASKQAEKNAAAAFKAAGKTQGSGSKNTTKKTSTYSNKTAKQNSTVTKGKVDKKGNVKKQSNIRARATQATKNYISGKSSNASGKKMTGTEKLRNSVGWNMTQEERFLKQRQYQRTAADTSKNKYKSITANAKDEADTRETIAKNYNKYAAQTARQAKENADKYRKTGEDKYLDQAKSDLNRARTFEHQRDWAVTSAFQARQDAAFQETASKYDKYLKDTNPEYKAEDSLSTAKDRLEKAKKDMQDLQGLMSPLAMSKKGNQEKLKKAQKELESAKKAYDKLVKNAETSASDKYKEMFGDLTSDVDKQKLKDEAERLINLEAPTQSQQAEIRVIKKMYDQLPADEKDRRVQDRLFANSGTTMSRITQTIGAGVSSALAGLERLPEFIEGLNETTSRNIIGGGEGMKPYVPEGAAEAVSIVDSEDLEKKRQKAMEWLDKQATKSEKKAEARRTNAQQNASELGKAAVDLGITLTQVGLDTLAGGQGKALAMMGARVLGGTYHEAKESGADTDDAVMYAGLQATKEILSEKIFGTALPVYGKGMARSLESAIERAVDKAAMRAATKAGERATKFFFQSLANFVEEGGEEIASGAFDPLVRAATIGDKSDLKAYVPGTEEFQAWTDDLVDQFVMGGLAGFIGGTVTQVGQGLPGVDEKTRADIEKAKAFVPTKVSDFSQSLINNGIKNKAAVNADTVISNLVTNESEVTDKEINKMLDDLHITKKGAKTAGAQRNLTALKNRLGLTDLDDNISRADLVKAIREGAKIAKQNADMQTDADVRGMEEQQEANQVGAEVDEAEQGIADAERSQQTITIGDETLTRDQYAERIQALAEADGNVLTDEQINTLWDQAVSEFGTPVEEEAPPQQIEGQMDLFGEMGRTEDEEAKFLEDTFGIKSDDEGQMNMFDAMDEDTFKEQTFGIKKQKDEMETLAEETQRKQNSVLEKNEAADKLAPETQEDLNTLAGNIGYRIEVHDHIDDPRGAADMENAIINGYIDKDTGTIHIAMDATDDIETTRSRILKVVAIHETTHGLETLAPEEYQAYSDYVENNWDVLNDGEDFATALENKMKQYADAGQPVTENGARQELMAEFASHMDQDAIFDFVNSNPTIGQKIVDMFREIVSRLKETFGMAGDAETALRKWERAYQAAVKGTANVNNDTQVDEAYRAGVEVQDSDGEPVAIMSEDGQAQFSLRTYNEKGRDVLKRWLKRAQDEGLSEQDAKDIETEMEHIYEVCKEYADSNKYAPFGQWSNATVKKGKNDKPLLSVVTPNGEYKLNLDVALVCKKRQTLDKVFDRLIKRGVFDNFDMGQEDIANINQIIVKHKFETACAICFVESKRFRQAKIAEDFANQYNELVQSMMPEGAEATYFNFGGDPRLDEHNATVTNDVSQMDKSQLDFTRLNELDAELNDKGKKATRVDNKIARYLLKHPEGRHFVNRTDFIASSGFENVKAVSPDVLSLYNSKKGSGGPKSAFGFAQYMHEILSKSNFNAKAAYAVGGVRIQSFSDFVPRMFFDYAEIVGDLATKQLPAHAYTKEEAFVKLFGLTGIKINMSLVPASVEDGQAPGLDADGNYAWEKGQTFDYNIAIEIQKAKGYGDNCGTIAVGVSDAHIRKMMADKNIRMIIPYHKSSLNPIIAAMNGISDFTDYTTYQNTRYADGTKLSDDDAKNEVNFNVFMHEQSMDPQQAAEAYVRWCEENDYLPKFDQFAYAQDKNGEYIVENGKLKVDENYYKLLEDFTLYNEPANPKAQRGSYVPQHEVKLRLPKDGDAFGSWQSLLTEDTYDEKGNLKYKGALKADTELDQKQNDEIDALVDDIIQNLNTPAVRERVSQEQIKARQKRGDALRAAERQRYEEGLAKRKAAVQPSTQKAAPTSSGAVQYSLTPVPPVQNTSDTWRPGATFDEVKSAHPNLYDTEGTEEEVSNKTQIQGTKKTYDKVLKALIDEGFTGSILDASSGLGLGTELGKEYGEKYGFTMEDIEPYPNLEKHTPDYTDYSTLNKKYDFIISNAVLNVVPQDQRDALVVKMGELLNDGGRMFINVRGKDVLNSSNKEAINEDLMEYYIPGSRSYQKGFTRQELKAYLEDALGDGYRVETDMGAFKTSGVPVLVYKEGTTAQYSLGSPRTSNSVLGQNNTVPTEEEIKSGSATYGGLPIVYHPEMKADARNMDTEVWVSDKFFNDPDQQHILNHEVAHNLSDELMSMHTGDWQEFASNFIEEKQTPPSSSAYANGNRTYWEGLYGDIGATALSETTTQAISEYLDDPERLRQRSEDAYEVIDNFMRSREDNTQFSISENKNDKTSEVLRKMYESLGLSPNAQPMTFAKETKQSKVNTNTFTNTTIFDDAMQYARDSNERIRMQVASDRIKEIGEYDVVSEQESMARAKERLEADYQGEVNKLILEDHNNEEWGSTDLDVAMGIMHTELARGDIDAFYDAAKAVQEKGTKAGQLIQAFAKYSRTPEGVAVQALDDIEEKLGKIPPDLKERIGMLAQELRAIEDGDMDSIIELIKKQAKIRKTPIGKHTINQLYKETYQANYDRAVTQLLGIAQDEEAKHIKADAKSIGQKISTWQLVSHLLNFRTGARNVVSNTVFGFAETIANDLALVPDFLVSLGTGNRTVGGEILTPKALAAGVARARSSAIDIKLDVAPDDSRTKYGNTRRTWKMASRNPGAKAMSVLEMLMGYELNVTDEFAKGMHEYRVRSGLQKWVDAGMYDEKTVDQFAEKEMLYRTFQDDTFPGMILGGIKKGLNVIGFGHTGQYLGKGQKFEVKQFGMGDLVQKYTQVPGALLARLVEYSPAGYAKAIYNLGQIANAKAQLSKEGKKNRPSAKKTEDLEQKLLSYQRELSLSMGRATTGAGLIQMFFALAASGLLHDEGSEDDDDQAAKNEAAIRALQGISGTQLNLSALGRWIDNHNDDLKWKSGDTLINIDFLEPMNGLMSIAAVLAQDEYFNRDDIDYTVMGGDILHSIVNSFAQVPTMQSIQNIQNAVQYHSADSKYRVEFEVGLELLKGSVTGFVPGPVRQAAQYQDDYYRETYGSNDPIEQMRDALKNAIPGQRQTLDTKLTPYGTDKEMEDRRMRALNAFVNPGKLSEYKESELESILSGMGAAKLYPTRKAPNKLGFGNGKKLTPSEKRMYLETMGQTYTEEMNKIISTDAFKNASKGEQRDRLLGVKTFADQYAKTKIAENLGTTYGDSDTVDKTLTAIDKGIDLPQWIDYKSDIKGLNAKDKNGNSVDGLKKERTVAVIADMDISDEAKDYLYVELQKSNGVKEENLLKGLEKTPWHGGSGKFTK